MIAVTELPLVNALLNGSSAAFLSVGYYFVRRKNISAHRRCMILALFSSLLFLISYLLSFRLAAPKGSYSDITIKVTPNGPATFGTIRLIYPNRVYVP